MRDHQQTRILESTSALGGVFIELYGEFGHRPVPFPVLSGLPASPFPLAGGCSTLGSGPSPSAHLEGGPARHDQHQRPGPAHRQPMEGTRLCLLSGPEGIASREGSSPPSPGNWLPITLAYMPSRALSIPPPSVSSSHPPSRYTLFFTSQVKPVAISALSPPAPTPPPPRTLESGDLVWEVSWILAVRCRGRGFHYLVDWVVYGLEDCSWVLRSYFADPSLLEDFYRANPKAVGRSPGVSRREGSPVASQQSAMPPTQVSSTRPRAGNQSAAIRHNPVQLRLSSRHVQSPSRT